MLRRFPSGRALHRAVGLLALPLVLAACGSDGATGPRGDRSAVRLAFVDNLFRLTLLRTGETPVTTEVSGIVPFAASEGRVAYWQDGVLRLYDVDAGTSTATAVAGLPPNTRPAGALSLDGRRLAFVSGAMGAPVHIHVVDLVTGARDSTNLALNVEPATTSRILDAAPIFSPDGQRIGFLLPTMLAMHFFIAEPFNWRTEMHLLWVATATTVAYVPGSPRWLADGNVRFVARKRTLDAVPVDTMMILSVHPNRGELGAIIEHEAPMPDTLSLHDPRGYSFTADGRTAALTVTSNGRDGVFLLREGGAAVEPLLFDAAQVPRYPIIVP